jgi:hypothetical protein
MKPLANLINQLALRLISKAEKQTGRRTKKMFKEREEVKTAEETETSLAQTEYTAGLPDLPQEFVKAEKNLETLGFFTPSSKQTRNKVDEKIISFTTIVEGKKVKANAVILPSAKYGLPDTSDLDKYRAFQKILSDELIRNGKVPKHITFTSAELIEAMGKKRRGGEIHNEIKDWLMRMISTTISSEGAVWLAGRKVWATDAFHVFGRVIAYGQELEDGTVADCHHVWLSDWQLENINEFWLLSIDYDLHKQLRKPIAKSLLPLLQIGFYASGGNYTKRYDELSQFLGIKTHQRYSYIKRQLEPSFKELRGKGFLGKWDYDKNNLYKTYNIAWQAGERFYEAQEILRGREMKLTVPASHKPKRITRPKKQPDEVQLEVTTETQPVEPDLKERPATDTKPDKRQLSALAQELVERGISESVAIDFSESFPEEYIREKIKMHDVKKGARELTTNASGWLREAIVQDYKLSEEQQRKLEAKARYKEGEEREEKLKAEAKKIQEQRIKEALAQFLEKDEWVEERVQQSIEIRKMIAQSSGLELLTDEEIEERRRGFHEQYPMTKEEKRRWLAGEDSNCRLENIMDELKKGE